MEALCELISLKSMTLLLNLRNQLSLKAKKLPVLEQKASTGCGGSAWECHKGGHCGWKEVGWDDDRLGVGWTWANWGVYHGVGARKGAMCLGLEPSASVWHP